MKNQYLISIFKDALQKLGADNELNLSEFNLIFETPKNEQHGDISTNIAMQLAKAFKKNPMQIANDLLTNLTFDSNIIQNINALAPGFINIKFSNLYYIDILSKNFSIGNQIGRQNIGNGTKVNLEYVSANPTGLLHLGHGRNACLGDTLANLYDWMGYEVTKEYYFNNAGNQMNNLTLSIYSRYMQIIVDENFPFPENGYFGEYIKLIAAELVDKFGKDLKEDTEENKAIIKKYGEEWCFKTIKSTLQKMNIVQDVFYNEDSLYTDGKIKALLEELKEKNLSYEKDGAVWMKLSEMGLSEDRVIVKSSGEPTYRLPDIAYHKEKFLRGYDILVDVFGADHIATVPDVIAGIKHLGFDETKVNVVIHQFVTLTENGVQVKMSKRTGKSYTLDDLLEEVGADVVRFFFIMRSCNTHLEFDLALAKEQSDKNPVFYLQYAHARSCSVINNLLNSDFDVNQKVDFENYTLNEHEIKLIKSIDNFSTFIELATNKNEPYILVEYLKDLAASFHNFYHNCRIIDSDEKTKLIRYTILETSRRIFKNGLTILGVSSPEKM